MVENKILNEEELKKVVGGTDSDEVPDFDYIVRQVIIADKGLNKNITITDGTYVVKITTNFTYDSSDHSYSGSYSYNAYKDDVLVKCGGEGDFLFSGGGSAPSPWRFMV